MADPLEDLRDLARALCASVPEPFALDTLHEAAHLAHHDPAALTDRHLQHVGAYEPQRVLPLLKKRAEARRARADGAFAEAQQRTADASEAFVAAPGIIYKHNAEAGAAIDAGPLKSVAEFADLLDQHPDVPVTAGLLAHVVRFADAMNENNKVRNSLIQALEQRTADLAIEVHLSQLELAMQRGGELTDGALEDAIAWCREYYGRD